METESTLPPLADTDGEADGANSSVQNSNITGGYPDEPKSAPSQAITITVREAQQVPLKRRRTLLAKPTQPGYIPLMQLTTQLPHAWSTGSVPYQFDRPQMMLKSPPNLYAVPSNNFRRAPFVPFLQIRPRNKKSRRKRTAYWS